MRSQLHTFDDADGDKRLVVSIEVPEAQVAGGTTRWTAELFDALSSVNQDFRESRRMVPPGKGPTLEFYAHGTGPFEGADIRIKRTYVAKAVA